jgi:hypothetical protein
MPTLKAVKRQLVPPHDDVVFVIMIVRDVLALQLLNPKRQPQKGRMLLIIKCGIRRSMAHEGCSSLPSVMSDIIISLVTSD